MEVCWLNYKKKIDIKLFLSPKVLPVDIFLVMTQIKLILKYKKRNKYAHLALKSLGIHQISFYNLKCGSLDTYPIIEIGKIIESEIYNFKPETIFTIVKMTLIMITKLFIDQLFKQLDLQP